MEKNNYSWIKNLVISLVVLCTISSVYAETKNILEHDVGDFNFIKSDIRYSEDFISTESAIYLSSNNVKFEVQITEFDDSDISGTIKENLDFWISPKIETSSAVLNRDGNTIYIDNSGSSIFWRNGPLFIKITLIRNVNDERKIDDENIFPSNLIDSYLNDLPSECNADHCRLHDDERWEIWLEKNRTIGDFNRLRNERRVELLDELAENSSVLKAKQEIEHNEFRAKLGLETINSSTEKPTNEEVKNEIRRIQSEFLIKIKEFTINLAQTMGLID